MSWDRSENHILAEEAAHWLIELEDADEATLSRFASWLEVSPRHVEELLLAAAVWKEFDQFDRAHQLNIQKLLEEARSNVRTLTASSTETTAAPPEPGTAVGSTTLSLRPHRLKRAVFAAVAVAATLVVGAALWLLQDAPLQTYATTRGEQRALKLEDGSVVYLNTQSRVEVQFSKNVRAIRLLDGEAMFNVEHDASRPFRVTAGATVIQAIGTRFNVYRSDAGSTVSVVEGVVQISPAAPASPPVTAPSPDATAAERSGSAELHRARVSAGEQARVSLDGEIVTRSVPDLAQIVSWRERRLVFRAESLGDVATQFNRYNAVQIHVEGDSLRGKQITGVFDADDPRSFIQFLQRDGTLSVDDGGSEIAIRPR